MARILYWNINNFSLNKVGDPTNLPAAQDRRAHIVDEVFLGLPAPPDIFVVVEVHGRSMELRHEGRPITGNARMGVQQLLAYIRAQTGQPAWMVVPPLWSGALGSQEAIAVFYNSATLQFTGPWVYGPDYTTATRNRRGDWDGAPLLRGCPLADTVRPHDAPNAWRNGPSVYPPLWRHGYLPARVTPGGVLPNEDRLAGQYEFWMNGRRIFFPDSWDRSPFLTHFLDGGGRTIKLFAVHPPPGKARDAVRQIARIGELVPAANEVTVLLGDFNVDPFDYTWTYNGLVNPPGGPLAGLGMTMAFSPGAGVFGARRPYCTTHLLPVAHATPNGRLGGVAADPTHDVYPRFGYMGTMAGQYFQVPATAGAIDNVLTLYGAGAAGPAVNATIVNTIVGKPYGAVAPPPANVTAELTGGFPVASTLANPIPQPAGQDSTAFFENVRTAQFRTWPNFERIRNTSDHLALAIDV